MMKRYVETDEEVLKVNARTGEILLAARKTDTNIIKETKLQAFKLLSPTDFVQINGIWEAKRDALIKILSSLPISYSWKITDKQLTKEFAQVQGVLTIQTGSVSREADSMGICEYTELSGNGGLHFMNARAETRALKRAIETLFGSVINYYVVNHLIVV